MHGKLRRNKDIKDIKSPSENKVAWTIFFALRVICARGSPAGFGLELSSRVAFQNLQC